MYRGYESVCCLTRNGQNWPLMANLTPELNSTPKITLENGLRCYFIKSYHQKATKCTYQKISRILLLTIIYLKTLLSRILTFNEFLECLQATPTTTCIRDICMYSKIDFLKV